jgi:hypothetical protein
MTLTTPLRRTHWVLLVFFIDRAAKQHDRIPVETTRKFYLVVKNDLLDRARQASTKAMDRISVVPLLRAPSGDLT